MNERARGSQKLGLEDLMSHDKALDFPWSEVGSHGGFERKI